MSDLSQKLQDEASFCRFCGADDLAGLLEKAAVELRQMQARIDGAPVALMDTRDALGICAPTEGDFPAIYALQGKRVRLVLDEPSVAEANA